VRLSTEDGRAAGVSEAGVLTTAADGGEGDDNLNLRKGGLLYAAMMIANSDSVTQ
jgi:hypothetical protein